MNIKKYEAFLRAVELGSLSKAAEELGYTQSGISHMMQSLEEEVGFSLLVRTPSGISPNEEGARLLPAVRQLLSTNDALVQTIAKIKGADTGLVRVIAFPSVAAYWLPEITGRFQRDYPQVEVVVREGDENTVGGTMETHGADLCIDAGGTASQVDWTPLCRDRLMAVFPPEHPLAGEASVPLKALGRERLLLPQKGYGCEARPVLDHLSGAAGVRFVACSEYVVLSMVAAGLGVSILPELLLRNYQWGTAAVPLEPAQYRTLGIGTPRQGALSPAARNFAEYVRAYVREQTGRTEGANG